MTATFTAAVAGTGNYSSAVTWSASAGTITATGVFTAPNAPDTTVTVTATSTQDSTKSGSASVKVFAPLAVSVALSAATVNTGAAITLSATVTGGTGSATVAWSAQTGTFNPTTGLTSTYTAPAAVPNPATVTITATATDSSGSAVGTAAVTVAAVQRTVTISLDPSIDLPENEIYSDYGTVLIATIDCVGCEVGDTLNAQSQNGLVITDPYVPGYHWVEGLNSVGGAFIPGPIKMWVTGADNPVTNTLRFTFDGGSLAGWQDPVTGEMYYYYGGDGSPASPSTISAFNPDGTADGTPIPASGESPAFTLDLKTGFAFYTDTIGLGVALTSNPTIGYEIPIGEVAALDSNNGLVCAVRPNTDTTYCFMASQAAIPQSDRIIATIGFPKGSQPAAVKVVDSSHVVVFTRGDSKLTWFTISGSTATQTGTLALSEFTNADAAYWQKYPLTGGGNMVAVGTTLGVMGRVVNADGTVSVKLALVDTGTQTVSHYADLPAGTIFLAADPTNAAIVAEYPDYSGETPVTAFTRTYVSNGNSALLRATSTLLPGAAFFVTKDGSKIAIFVQGKSDFPSNQ